MLRLNFALVHFALNISRRRGLGPMLFARACARVDPRRSTSQSYRSFRLRKTAFVVVLMSFSAIQSWAKLYKFILKFFRAVQSSWRKALTIGRSP